MDKEKIMHLIAKELGVDVGEGFYILTRDGDKYREPLDSEPCVYTVQKHCIRKLKDGFNYESKEAFKMLFIDNYEIKKLPWEPKQGEKYFYPHFAYSSPLSEHYWCGDAVDNRIKKHVGVYKTEEEALEKAKELGWIE